MVSLKFAARALACMLSLNLVSCSSGSQPVATQPQSAAPVTALADVLYSPVHLTALPDPAAAAAQLDALLTQQPDNSSVLHRLAAELQRLLDDPNALKSASLRPTGEENQVTPEVIDDGGNRRIEWDYLNCGDYDQNGEVNAADIVPISVHFNAAAGSPGWDSAMLADGDGNGEVNLGDVTPIAVHFSVSCGGFNIYGRDADSGPWTPIDSVPMSVATGSPRLHFSRNITAMYAHYALAAYDFAGDDAPAVPLVSSAATVLEDSGITIESIAGGTVFLQGDTTELTVGSVIVSSAGKGYLGKIDSFVPAADGTAAVCSQATLEDLFDFADINFSRGLSLSDLDHFDPAIEGVELLQGTASAVAGDKAGSVTLPIRVKFPEKELGAGFKLQGVVDLALNLDVDIRIGDGWEDFGTLYYFNFETGANVTGTLELKLTGKTNFTDKAWLLGSMYFAPIPLLVGPVPVVFTPQVDLYCGATLAGEVGIEAKPSLTLMAKAGLEYTPENGWDPYYDLDYDWSFGLNKPNVYGKVEGTINLFSPEPTLELYGVAGPYAKFYAPYGRLVAQIQTTPPEFSLTGWLGAKGMVGAQVEVLGYELANVKSDDLFDVQVKVYEQKWPLTPKPLTFEIDWESHYAGVPVSSTDMYKPYLGIYKPGVGNWYLSYTTRGSFEEQPFGVWRDATDYGADGEATAGKIVIDLETLEPGDYTVRLDAPVLSHCAVEIKQVKISGTEAGSGAGTYAMANGAVYANHAYYALVYHSADHSVDIRDESFQLSDP